MYKNNNGNPCKPDCPNRTPTCKFDGSCNKYSEWRKEFDDLNNKRWKEVEAQAALDNYTKHVHRRFVAGKLRNKKFEGKNVGRHKDD